MTFTGNLIAGGTILAMRRRDFAGLVGSKLLHASANKKAPNILFLLTDDQRRDTISALGNPHIQTPNLDRLVRSGVTFSNAYCMGGFSPAVCLPSRMMMQRGQSWFAVQRQKEPKPCIAQTMNEAGYETFHLGKKGNEDLKAHAFYQHNHYLEPDDNAERLRGRPSEQMADRVTRFLKERNRDKPFFLYLADSAPHDPRLAPPEYLRRYDPDKLPLPRNYRPFHPFNNGELLIRDEKLAPWPRTGAEIRRHLQQYYAVITFMDEQIGRVFRALEETGEADNTIIAFTADQGIAIGSHGLMGKQNLYEHSMRVPLVFAGPRIPRNRKVDGFTYQFDMYPTLCELAGIPAPSGIEGRSIARAVVKGSGPTGRDAVFLAYRDFQRAVRRGPYKLIRYPQVNRTQLFRLDRDPDEVHDLSREAGESRRVAEMTALLAEQQKMYGDQAPMTVAGASDGGDISLEFFAGKG